ncbi:uncharacterized protein M421DRAFT_3831 [Didymella exigua CBS 183.55]|uniref:Uncharacterized protein n=1 Tax=Didymella exigua CBS 183.55 TaxID=1150837 RepID=A0A6A5RRJ5_9PLEO|nr:uncharacterized protein M421DRAFT_3831 [Didymella exigua CBS 183.55]KAF1930073.1 hypothetical protein M421DRAFT_3831 [Didymella exigua CBS 183.55]
MLENIEKGAGDFGKLRPQSKVLEQDMISVRNSILKALQSGLTADSSKKNLPKMMQLVDKAFALMSKMGFQRSGPALTSMPWCLSRSPDGDRIAGGIVSFIVNPGLTKWGDARGKNLDQSYGIVPSLVRLEIQEPKQVSSPA